MRTTRANLGLLGLLHLAIVSGVGCASFHRYDIARMQEMSDVARMEISRLLERQAAAWNRGDIEGFLEGYDQSAELSFSAGGETHRGFAATRRRYLERYPDRATMGQLTFDDLEIQWLNRDSAYVLGRWHLNRERNSVGGNFTLVLRFDGRWRIVHDHTSVVVREQSSFLCSGYVEPGIMNVRSVSFAGRLTRRREVTDEGASRGVTRLGPAATQ